MSKYTTQVRFICESEAGLTESTGFDNVNEVLELACPKVFNFDFPIFDESYRVVLEKKILKHYYTREIGAETYGLWKLWLDARLNEIMPYYNQLYRSATLTFNPFYDVDLSREHKMKSSGITSRKDKTDSNSHTVRDDNTQVDSDGESHVERHDDSTSDGTNLELYSDTPQDGVNGLFEAYGSQSQNYNYLTNATKNINHNHTEGDPTSDSTYEDHRTVDFDGDTTFTGHSETKGSMVVNNMDDYVEKVSGKQGGSSYSKMLKEFRETFLNIDMDVINDLRNLFLNLW